MESSSVAYEANIFLLSHEKVAENAQKWSSGRGQESNNISLHHKYSISELKSHMTNNIHSSDINYHMLTMLNQFWSGLCNKLIIINK